MCQEGFSREYSISVNYSHFCFQKYLIVEEKLQIKFQAAEEARQRAEELRKRANKLASEAQVKLSMLKGKCLTMRKDSVIKLMKDIFFLLMV